MVAFCLAASIFAMFLYLTLYIQDNLGYGPLAAGVRFLPMTLVIFFTSFFAGRLTVRVQLRVLLGIGMLFVTGGLLLMATTHPDSTWTVLLPGFLVAGFGVGIVNPVLASGAVSVVQPQRVAWPPVPTTPSAKLASPAGIAVLGAVFQSQIVAHTTAGWPSRLLAPRSYAGAVRNSRAPCPPARSARRRRPSLSPAPGTRCCRPSLGVLGDTEPPDGDRCGGGPGWCCLRVRAVRQRDFVIPSGSARQAAAWRRAERSPGAGRGRRPRRPWLNRSPSRARSSGWSR